MYLHVADVKNMVSSRYRNLSFGEIEVQTRRNEIFPEQTWMFRQTTTIV